MRPSQGFWEQGNKALYFRGTREQKSKTEGNSGTKNIWEQGTQIIEILIRGNKGKCRFLGETREQVPPLGGLTWIYSKVGAKMLIDPVLLFSQSFITLLVSMTTMKWFLIVLGFNDTSTLEGHFVSSPREREKRDRRDSRGDESGGQGRKRNRNESEETEEIKTFPLYPYLLQG